MSDPWPRQSLIQVVPSTPRPYYFRRGRQAARFLKRPPKAASVFHKPRAGTPAGANLQRVEGLAARSIDGKANGADVAGLIAEITRACRLNRRFVEGCLRTLVAEGHFVATQRSAKAKVFLKLSSDARAYERRRAYAASFAHELESQSDQLGRLIVHGGTIGSCREDLLRELIQRHIPQRFHAATGFIDGRPNQIDILIYDRIDYAPLFRAGDLVVVPPEAVRALIEVKSSLNAAELKDALWHLAESQPGPGLGPAPFVGVFGYEGASADTLAAAIKAFHTEAWRQGRKKREPTWITGPEDLATVICVLKASALVPWFLALGDNGVELTPVVFDVASLAQRQSQAAVFFDMLLRHLRHPIDGPLTAPLPGAIFEADLEPTLMTIIEVGQWGPYAGIGQSEVFEAQFSARLNWLGGGRWDPEGRIGQALDAAEADLQS